MRKIFCENMKIVVDTLAQCAYLLINKSEKPQPRRDIMSANYTFSMIHIDGTVSSEMTFDEFVTAHIKEQLRGNATPDEYTLDDGVIIFQGDVKVVCANEVNPKGRIW